MMPWTWTRLWRAVNEVVPNRTARSSCGSCSWTPSSWRHRDARVRRANSRITKLRLSSGRPFEFKHVALRDAAPPLLLPEDSEGVGEFLAHTIQQMTDRAAAGNGQEQGQGLAVRLMAPCWVLPRDPSVLPPPPPPPLPLMRLRVDYTASGNPEGVDIAALTAGIEGGATAADGAVAAATHGSGTGATTTTTTATGATHDSALWCRTCIIGAGGNAAAVEGDSKVWRAASPSSMLPPPPPPLLPLMCLRIDCTASGNGRGGRDGRGGGGGGSHAGTLAASPHTAAAPGKGVGAGARRPPPPSDDDVAIAGADSDKDAIEDGDDDSFAVVAPPAKRAARGGVPKPRADAAAAAATLSRGRSMRAAAAVAAAGGGGGGEWRWRRRWRRRYGTGCKSYRVDGSDGEGELLAYACSDGVEDIEDHSSDGGDDSPPPSAGWGRGRGSWGAAAAAAGTPSLDAWARPRRCFNSSAAGRGRGASMRASKMPRAALAHAAAGAAYAYASSALPDGGGPKATGTTVVAAQVGRVNSKAYGAVWPSSLTPRSQ
ncbi:hypothetical protein HYH02_004783 [Chlamydomonas schloesseri]|uniref:Mre11 DNA-binding domain-containing protein n=1 Tax=Chlamydomonas schloesseri TaxID=2026947 RepID=A0A835WMU7_9CHLO|nr:hypothetical protein HYH02_004783 [Chlamydomonas schloesseri]|eukprot:KAG2450272.1 hypothetical protein HYH02_004783 [Chlamydomonas schloesseri]